MEIPSNFGVEVRTPEPLTVKIDVSEKAMLLGVCALAFVGVTIIKLKK